MEDVFPAGVYNVITGGPACGAALVAHPQVAKVAMIGSPAVGKAILRGAADTMKRVALELGGKNALIAYPDSDPDTIAAAAVAGMNFTWASQSCGSTSRVFLHESHHDDVLARIVSKIGAYKPGIPTDPATTMGPLISRAQLDKVLGFIESAHQQGARLVTGGGRPDDPVLANGFFVEPTVFADVTMDMRIAREEVFGPVVSILKWSDEDRRRVHARHRNRPSGCRPHPGRLYLGQRRGSPLPGGPLRRLQAIRARARGEPGGAPFRHADQERQRPPVGRPTRWLLSMPQRSSRAWWMRSQPLSPATRAGAASTSFPTRRPSPRAGVPTGCRSTRRDRPDGAARPSAGAVPAGSAVR
jgi:hypothetical protein